MRAFLIVALLSLSVGSTNGLSVKPEKDNAQAKEAAQDFNKWASDAKKNAEKLQKDYEKSVKKATKESNEMLKGLKESSLIEKPKDLMKSAMDDQKHQEHDLSKLVSGAQKDAEKLQKDYTKEAAKAAKQNDQLLKSNTQNAEKLQKDYTKEAKKAAKQTNQLLKGLKASSQMETSEQDPELHLNQVETAVETTGDDPVLPEEYKNGDDLCEVSVSTQMSKKKYPCEKGKSFGCVPGKDHKMWVFFGCDGTFNCNGHKTRCVTKGYGREDPVECVCH